MNVDNPVFIPPVVASGRMCVLTDKASLIALNLRGVQLQVSRR
jgi:hypothetical protein